MKDNNSFSEDKKEFSENPYSTDKNTPADLVRLFYINEVPVIPVVSNRGILLGVIKKDDVIAELSDIQRSEKIKIDQFIKNVIRKISLDEALIFGNYKEFIIINLFGELKGKWSRIQLFTALEGPSVSQDNQAIEQHQEDQVLEWIIYLILEHIPRPLYAVNDKGKTIFYNNYFEDLYFERFNSDPDTRYVERLLKNDSKNTLITENNYKEIYYINNELGLCYEKIPMLNKKKRVGYLFFCNKRNETPFNFNIADFDIGKFDLLDMLAQYEKNIIMSFLNHHAGNITKTAKALKVNKQTLKKKISKYEIKV